MGRRKKSGDGIIYLILIFGGIAVVKKIIDFIGFIFKTIIEFVESVFKAIGAFFTALFEFISSLLIFLYSNILFIIGLCLIIGGMILLFKVIKNRTAPSFKRPKLKKRTMPAPAKPVKHILHDSLSKIISSYGLDILSAGNSQKCRGLLKDFEGNMNINDINEVSLLLDKDIYSRLIVFKNQECTKTFLMEKIYKHLKKENIAKGQNREALELIVDLMAMNNSLTIKPVNQIKKIDWINIFYRIIYYFSFLINFFRYKYKLILPSLLSIAGAVILIFS